MKSKQKTIYTCQNCGAQRPKWEGRCPECGAWNSLVEELYTDPALTQHSTKGWIKSDIDNRPKLLTQEQKQKTQLQRYTSQLKEWDRVLGGGLVASELVLLGGAPGIGKSTLLLQVVGSLDLQLAPVLYVSGEESVEQTQDRAERLGVEHENLYLFNESNLQVIDQWVESIKPKLLIIDSIQTIYRPELSGAPGTVSQVRECAAHLLNLAKSKGISMILVGHITKDGNIAGPKVLEHMVDAVLYFEGDEHQEYRLLRAIKNRFGPAGELGVFSMSTRGLLDVTHPSFLVINHLQQLPVGSSLYCSMEGSRPFLCELQSLNVRTSFPAPRRTVVGLELQRLHLILAIMEKHLGLSFVDEDVYVSVIGGLNIQEPGVDLAIAASILSSLWQQNTKAPTVFFGELGLTGEVRPCRQLETRLKEALRLGITQALVSSHYKPQATAGFDMEGMQLHYISHVRDLARWFRETKTK